MNRQQRRLQAKKMVEQYDFRQEKRKFQEDTMLLYCVCLAYAVYDVYGKMPTRVQKLTQAFSKRVAWAVSKNLTYKDLERDLYNKTELSFQFMEDEQ